MSLVGVENTSTTMLTSYVSHEPTSIYLSPLRRILRWIIFSPYYRTTSFEFNVEKVTPTRHGHRRATVQLMNRDCHPNALIVTTTTLTEGGSVHLVETRRLVEGGHDHIQVGGNAVLSPLGFSRG